MAYLESMEAGRLGALADTNEKTLISRNAEAIVTFGMPVVQGTADRQCLMADTGDTVILGISVRERSAVDDQWAIGESVRIMTEGTIWVTAGATVAAGDPVHVLVATQAFSNAAGVVIVGARYEDSGVATDLVRIRLA